MAPRWPVDVRSIGSATAGARVWTSPAGRHLTVVVKAALEIVHDAQAAVLPEAEIVTKDTHYLGSPGRSVERASDLAIYLPRCDVTLQGHAFAPAGQPARGVVVRLALARGAPILDKKLFVYGDVDAAAPEGRAPFQRMPVDYEHAFGGRSHAPNPVGRGAEAKGAAPSPPNVVHPSDARVTAGFGPLSRFWADRARWLGSSPRKSVDGDEPQIESGFDWRYLQSAPADQQIPYLAGDEWVVVDGMHPALPRIQTQLPAIRGAARLYGLAGGPRPLQLCADMLAIDMDRLQISMVWRGSSVLPAGIALETIRVVGALEIGGSAIEWPTEEEGRASSVADRAPEPPREAVDGSATYTLSPEEALRAARAKADPFVAPGSRGGGASPPPSQRAVPPPTPSAPALKFDETVTTDGTRPVAPTLPFPHAQTPAVPEIREAAPPFPAQREDFSQTRAARPEDIAKAVENIIPFVPAGPDAPMPPPSSSAADLVHEFSGTVTMSPEAIERAKRQVLPFVLTRADRARNLTDETVAPKEAKPAAIPKRTSPEVPIVNATKLTAATMPWQVSPPQDTLTIIVKGTFDIVPGGPAKVRDEPDPLAGDAYVDDDAGKSLLVASDFAIMKPRADVLLSGHAIAPKGAPPHLRVSLKLGANAIGGGFERAILVVGDRAWNRGMLGVTIGDPAPFERMPLVHERAFGGPSYAQNPSGTGQRGTPPPNLEDPARLMKSPNDSPPPACFLPISPLWRERASKLGTYGAEWLSSRWPYFPIDFDWAHFQAAPKPQQIDHPRGDEDFEISGMHPEYAVVRGALPGLRVRAFALEAEGSELFEVPLRLDTISFDVDAMKVNLVWRGLFETSDDEASEIQTLFIDAEELSNPPMSLDDIRRRLIEHATVEAPEEEEPGGTLDIPPPIIADIREDVAARIAAGKAFDDADLQGGNLAGLDFSKRSLVSANLKDAVLAGGSLAGANLENAILAGADLRDTDLSGARLLGADLTGAKLEGARLDGADLTGAELSGAQADRASFENIRGAGAQFVGGSFKSARFVRAELSGANFTEAMLDGASFEDAMLSEVRLYFVKAHGARFDRAKLEEARCDDAVLVKCSMVEASAPSSVWEKAVLSGSNFSSAILDGASFTRAAADGCVFRAVTAVEARFTRAKLTNADFSKANLMKSDFERADLTSADLRGANLHAAETLKAKLAGAKLEGAILTATKLRSRST